MGETLVVAHGLAIGGLMLLAEMPAAGLVAIERVVTHELGELEEVGDASGLLEPGVELARAPGHIGALPELLAQVRDLGERVLEALGVAGHAAVVPHDLAEL